MLTLQYVKTLLFFLLSLFKSFRVATLDKTQTVKGPFCENQNNQKYSVFEISLAKKNTKKSKIGSKIEFLLENDMKIIMLPYNFPLVSTIFGCDEHFKGMIEKSILKVNLANY